MKYFKEKNILFFIAIYLMGALLSHFFIFDYTIFIGNKLLMNYLINVFLWPLVHLDILFITSLILHFQSENRISESNLPENILIFPNQF